MAINYNYEVRIQFKEKKSSFDREIPINGGL